MNGGMLETMVAANTVKSGNVEDTSQCRLHGPSSGMEFMELYRNESATQFAVKLFNG
jgi:hypothetical protein